MKMLSLKPLLALLLAAIVALQCGEDKALANEKRSQECLRLVWIELNHKNQFRLTPEEREIFENPSVGFAYSCTSVDGRSPSCRELYSTEPEAKFLTELCPDGFRKFRAKCSRQNQIGECLIFEPQENHWERRIYAKPNDDLPLSQTDCRIANGRFLEPESFSLPLALLVACRLDGN